MASPVVLTDAELLLGLSRHLGAYTMSSEKASLEQLSTAGAILDLAFRLRGSTTSAPDRVASIALDAGLGRASLRTALSVMESLNWLTVERQPDGTAHTVLETIPEPGRLVCSAEALLSIIGADEIELAVLRLLRATTLQPLLVQDALEAAMGTEPDSTRALGILVAVGLLRRTTADDGREVVFNPNVWVQDDGAIARTALRAVDAKATREVGALLEELAGAPAMPEAMVRSTEKRWIDFAVSQGLVQRSVIQTSEGNEQGFLFTPHLGRDPFGATAGDASGQVRQLTGSMVYAATYARIRLNHPHVFLRSLIRNGTAGNATAIGTDYPMLEKAGIVRVVPGRRDGYFALQLLQSDVAEEALALLEMRIGGGGTTEHSDDIAALRAQKQYIHVEHERARLASVPASDDAEQARLLAALRDVTTVRGLGRR